MAVKWQKFGFFSVTPVASREENDKMEADFLGKRIFGDVPGGLRTGPQVGGYCSRTWIRLKMETLKEEELVRLVTGWARTAKDDGAKMTEGPR